MGIKSVFAESGTCGLFGSIPLFPHLSPVFSDFGLPRGEELAVDVLGRVVRKTKKLLQIIYNITCLVTQ